MTVPISPGINPGPPPSLAELARRATVDKSDFSKYSVKTWISSVSKLYEQVCQDIAKSFIMCRF